MKLGLGTAQFGMDYGISTEEGKTGLNEVKAILKLSWRMGIDVIDTACLYGESESVLGRALVDYNKFRIITKTPVYKKDEITHALGDDLKNAFYGSLDRLRQPHLAGLLAHNADDLLSKGGDILFGAMGELKDEGLVEKIGASVYTAQQIDDLLERYDLDLIQVPLNVLDQRLVHGGHLKRLKKAGIEIHARSVFLQGLLLMRPESLPGFFDPIKNLLYEYREFLLLRGLTPLEGAFGFVKLIPEIDYIIIGVNNLKQLRADYDCFNKSYDRSLLEGLEAFSLNNPKYLNPALWELR